MKEVVFFLFIMFLTSLNSFGQNYTGEDLKNAAIALSKKDEWYIDKIKDDNLRNVTRAKVKKDDWYIDRIKD